MALEFVLSHASLLYQATLGWTVQRMINSAQEVGYAGIEYHPTRRGTAELATSPALDWPGIRSVHQSFRTERWPWECCRDLSRLVICLASWFIFEYQDDLDSILGLEFGEPGGPWPLVHFPDDQPVGELRTRYGRQPIFQPTPELGMRWGISTAEQLLRRMDALEYSGLCFDTHHWRRGPSDYWLPDWRQAWPELQLFVKELHVAAGRLDMPDRFIPTMNELAWLLGEADHPPELAHLLRTIAQSGWCGPVVVEVPATSIAAHLGLSPWRMQPAQLLEQHGRTLETLKTIFT